MQPEFTTGFWMTAKLICWHLRLQSLPCAAALLLVDLRIVCKLCLIVSDNQGYSFVSALYTAIVSAKALVLLVSCISRQNRDTLAECGDMQVWTTAPDFVLLQGICHLPCLPALQPWQISRAPNIP